jgi:hypothetical protein
MGQTPNAHLVRRATPREPQKADYPDRLYAAAGKLLVAERMRLNTQRLTAVFLSTPALSNVWWPIALRDGLGDDAAKALALWFNSSLGILSLMGSRVETEGAWVQFKKPILHDLPVLDVRQLDASQRRRLSEAFNQLATSQLQPLPVLATDPIRQAIDDTVCDELGLPGLGELRQRLAAESILTLQRLTQLVLR